MFYVFPQAVKLDICDDIIKDCKENILEEAKVYEFSGGDEQVLKNDPDTRRTSINFIKDKNNKANELAWHFLRKANEIHFHYDLKYFQPIQFAEYRVGDFFHWHQDASEPDQNNDLRKLSLTLVLSDPDTFEGGELQFYNGEKPFYKNGSKITDDKLKSDVSARGSVIVFDSRDFHRVTPVVKGIRHSVVCWCVGPNFK